MFLAPSGIACSTAESPSYSQDLKVKPELTWTSCGVQCFRNFLNFIQSPKLHRTGAKRTCLWVGLWLSSLPQSANGQKSALGPAMCYLLKSFDSDACAGDSNCYNGGDKNDSTHGHHCRHNSRTVYTPADERIDHCQKWRQEREKFYKTVSEIFNGWHDFKRPLCKGQGHSFWNQSIPDMTSYRLSIVGLAFALGRTV